jgi:hypothetical protein
LTVFSAPWAAGALPTGACRGSSLAARNTPKLKRGDRLREAGLAVICGARVTGDNGPSGHIVAQRTPDLGHASTRAEERQLALFAVLAGMGLSGLVDRGVQLAGYVRPRGISWIVLPGRPLRAALGRSIPKLENDGVR